jgi:hypothetical protein
MLVRVCIELLILRLYNDVGLTVEVFNVKFDANIITEWYVMTLIYIVVVLFNCQSRILP